VRAGCGQAGQAAAHFCARLNAFKRLTPLLCNSNEGSAFAHSEPCALRFEPPILHIDRDRAGARRLKAHIAYVLLIFLSSSRRPRRARFANPLTPEHETGETNSVAGQVSRPAFFSSWSCDGSLGAIV
jgi:hypothetical protein